jgi:hypothetical protein
MKFINMVYGFYSKNDLNQEVIGKTLALSRLSAAKILAERKNLDLKPFLKIYSVKKI